jgi:hypothetical protein
MHARLQTNKAKRMKKLRCSKVEPVLGTLVNFLNMRRKHPWNKAVEQMHVDRCHCLQSQKAVDQPPHVACCFI